MPSPLMISLYFSFALNVFRVVMYITNPEHVSAVKVSKQAWEDLNIREVMYAHTTFIRNFMSYRTIICGWAIMTLAEGPAMHSLCVLQTMFDLYLFATIVIKAYDKKAKVMLHHNILVPGSLQGVLCLVSVLCLVANHLQK